ncbi:MAG: Fur family transcriptional regulator [Pseudomonadota bacterium]|nr:Fur family transcriptional regulator [Pseudomonadota bacterium]
MSSEKLKNTGLKITSSRLAIYKVLEDERDSHLSAYDIQDKLKQKSIEIALATIYRVLGQFEESGLLLRTDFEDDRALYELHDGKQHDHMVCKKCSKVTDFFDSELEKRKDEILETYNFSVTGHHLILYGLCEECLSSQDKET